MKFLRTNWWWVAMVGLSLMGMCLRLVNLDWGAPWYFHPDERNIASAISRMYFSGGGDPEFYAYGTVPVYASLWLMGQMKLFFGTAQDPFIRGLLLIRFMSAWWSIALIPMIGYIGKRYFDRWVGLVAAVLTTFTVGFIQFAHYGTFEMWLTVSRVLLFWVAVELVRKPRWSLIWLTMLVAGLSIGTKVTNVIMLPGVWLALWLGYSQRAQEYHFARLHLLLNGFLKSIGAMVMIVAGALLIFGLMNPWSLGDWRIALLEGDAQPLIEQVVLRTNELLTGAPLQWKEVLSDGFVHSMNVEGGIARGEIEVFYTRQFTNTIPGVFQLTQVIPWILSVPMLLFGLVGFGWLGYRAVRYKELTGGMLVVWVLIQAVFLMSLYVKWSRYVVPMLPFWILAASVMMVQVWRWLDVLIHAKGVNKIVAWIGRGAIIGLIGWHVVYGLGFCVMYLQDDPRIEAAEWAARRIPANAQVVSEVYDMGIVPFNPRFRNIELLNFYDLDTQEDPQLEIDIRRQMDEADVMIILSRRVWFNAMKHNQEYPKAAAIYWELLAGETEYEQVYESGGEIDLGFWSIGGEKLAEETFTVFDRPRIQIWAKPGVVNVN